MSTFKLAFGIHNHQPIGNFEAVFQEAHNGAYLPFLKLLEGFPSISISLHQSGILWNWQKKAHPDYFEMVGRLIDSGRLELLTGGFYEPILTSIPERDALGQIGMLSDYLKDHFEVEPEGLWLTERIWEPHLPSVLGAAGVKFLPVDDTHFLYAGFDQHQLRGPFVTENEGKTVILLPIQKKLRYLIPFGKVEEVIDDLKEQAEKNPNGMAVYADDGEKFGVWPDTHQHCYKEKWLNRFFEAIEQNSDWLQVVPLSTAAAEKPAGRAYLPSASYAEMLHWALPPHAFLEYEAFTRWLEEEEQLERYGRFVRGSHWRNFLVKYEESNLMHKRMLAVSDRLHDLLQEHPEYTDKAESARRFLYAGQCNCPYWHGVFGGLYLPHIRRAVYQNLLEAQESLRQIEGNSGVVIKATDYDCDGHEELVVESDHFAAVIKPDQGGTLRELSLLRDHANLTDTLTRRKEGYHIKLDRALAVAEGARKNNSASSIHDRVFAKEEGLRDFLIEDWYLKRCFVDHFFTGDVDLDRFRSGRYGEEGDFILEPYTLSPESGDHPASLVRKGHLWRPEGTLPVTIEKDYSFVDARHCITVRYRLSCESNHETWAVFGVENNFTFQAGHAEDRFALVDGKRPENGFLDAVAHHEHVLSYAVIDQSQKLGVAVVCDTPGEFWRLPVFTVSLSEGGFERVYQGTTMVNVFRLRLDSRPVEIGFNLFAGPLAVLPAKHSPEAAVTC